MEIRQLTNDQERRVFADRVVRARATQGFGFKYQSAAEMERELKSDIAYGIFENAGAPAAQMVAGFAMHDLSSAAQSFPDPDLSYLPPETVIEGGALWSLSRGAAGIARKVAPVIVGILQAKAVLLYPICKPLDLTAPHRELGFVDACAPILNEFAQTLNGAPIWMQPLILEGEKLQTYIRWGYDSLFRDADGRQVFHLDNSRLPRALPMHVDSADRIGTRAA